MTNGVSRLQGWAERQADLLAFAERQIFFLGGAPRSGTTWLQSLIDAHPDVSCRGEAHFLHHLANPLDTMLQQRRKTIADKNERIFRHAAGYPLPGDDLADQLLATGIVLALQQQCAGRNVRAVGEKTPENVFLFSRLVPLFPEAKFIAIARDPRDVLASAWHFFRNEAGSGDAEKIAFLASAFPSLNEGARTTSEFCAAHPDKSLSVTYEGLLASTPDWAARIFTFLGVAADPATVSECVARTSFAAMTRNHRQAATTSGSFFRAGVAGSWRDTFDERMNEMILRELGWMFDHFGWNP